MMEGCTVFKSSFISAANVFPGWRNDVLTGEPPILFPVADSSSTLSKLEIGPGLVTLIGGAPGAGKTAFTMQIVVDALRLTHSLRAVICNIEMTPAVLLNRQLARLSGIDLQTIRYRQFRKEHSSRLETGLNTLEDLGDRLAFCQPPYDLGNVAATADAFNANLIVLDYIQRIAPPGEHNDKRGSVDACMNFIRQFADFGVAVIVVAAVSRTKDKAGRSSYDAEGLSLASFRESSELEFGADDAFILARTSEQQVLLKHLKARHSEPCNHLMDFDGALQRFTAVGSSENQGSGQQGSRFDVSALWGESDDSEVAL
jgi:replicative DNA helicase